MAGRSRRRSRPSANAAGPGEVGLRRLGRDLEHRILVAEAVRDDHLEALVDIVAHHPGDVRVGDRSANAVLLPFAASASSAR